jgi:hypothetical protein
LPVSTTVTKLRSRTGSSIGISTESYQAN